MVDILIVEDNSELCGLLCEFLRAEGYVVSSADSGEKALALYEKYGARLVLLDINLPDTDGFAVCAKIRENSNTPIIMLTARVGKEDKLNGLILGADDYIEKPYDIDILLAKIKGIFKRRFADDKITEGDITLDLAAGTVTKCGKPADVSGKEFELMSMLITSNSLPERCTALSPHERSCVVRSSLRSPKVTSSTSTSPVRRVRARRRASSSTVSKGLVM